MDKPWWKTTLKTDLCPIASTKDRNDEHCECVMELSPAGLHHTQCLHHTQVFLGTVLSANTGAVVMIVLVH